MVGAIALTSAGAVFLTLAHGCRFDGLDLMLFRLVSQKMISDASGGARASDGLVRALRREARCAAHPFGQDLGGVLHARRRHGGRHPYIRAVFDNERYAAVVLQLDTQMALSATQPVVMADTTFDVVAAGSANEGVAVEQISGAAPRAFDWHHFSIW